MLPPNVQVFFVRSANQNPSSRRSPEQHGKQHSLCRNFMLTHPTPARPPTTSTRHFLRSTRRWNSGPSNRSNKGNGWCQLKCFHPKNKSIIIDQSLRCLMRVMCVCVCVRVIRLDFRPRETDVYAIFLGKQHPTTGDSKPHIAHTHT